MNTYCKYITKIIFVGNSCIGKTAICDYLTNNIHNKPYEKTIGVHYITYNSTQNHKICIWDTAGDNVFTSFIAQYFNGADVICIFFKDSYCSIDKWYNLIIKNTQTIPVIFIININFNNKYVDANDIKIKAALMGAFYYELNRTNIYELFDIISLSFNSPC